MSAAYLRHSKVKFLRVFFIQNGLLPKPSPTPREICVTCRATSYCCSIVEKRSSDGLGAAEASGFGAAKMTILEPSSTNG